MPAIKTHLPPVDSEQEAVEIGEAVKALEESIGWAHLREAVGMRIEGLTKQLMDQSPRETASQYERTIGHMIGLRDIENIIQGLRARAEEANPDGI